MAQRTRSQRLNGLFPLSYIGVNPVSPINFIMDDRAPNVNDSKNFYIGDLWLDTSTQPPTTQNLWMLVSLVGNNATWVNFDAGAGDLDSLTGDTGGPVHPDGVGNINIISNIPGLTVDGNPGTNTLVLNIAGGGQLITTLTGNSGGPVGPTGIGNINVIGDLTTIDVVGTPGTNTLTISVLGTIATDYNGNIGSASPVGGILNILGSGGILTAAIGNTVTIHPGPTVATSYITNPATGTATPAMGVLTFAGGGGTTVTAAGSTITITSSGGGGGGSGAGGTIVTEYNAPGAGVHNLNADTQAVVVIGWAGGNGGGSGRQGASTAAGGGAGGAGGATFCYEAPVSFFGGGGAAVAYDVGGGGAGGAAQAAMNTDGNDGTAGGITSFGNITTGSQVAVNPPYGGGGTGAGSSAGVPLVSYVNSVAAANNLDAGTAGTGDAIDGNDGINQRFGIIIGSGGGGGGGADNAVERAGGDGGTYSTADNLAVLLAGGAGGTESGVINGGNGVAGAGALTIMAGGTGGGGGGGQSAGLVAGNGGVGGFPGGGGGGGGGSLNGTSSGAGGAGANGKLIVIEYLSAGSAATSFVADAGSAVPAAGALNILGSGGITTSGAGNTITIDGGGAAGSSIIMVCTGTQLQISTSPSVDYIPFGGSRGDIADTIESSTSFIITEPGTIDNLYLNIPAANNFNTGNSVLTLRVNQVDTALTVTAGPLADGMFTDLVNSVAVVAGDLVTMSSLGYTTGQTLNSSISLRFTPA